MTYPKTLAYDRTARQSRTAGWAWRLAGFSVPLLILGVLAHRWRYADTNAALAVFGAAFGLAALAILLSLVSGVSIWSRGGRGLGRATMALIFGCAVTAVPVAAGIQIFRLPMINDITTDPDALPAFDALASARQRDGAPSAYGGADIFLRQIEAYPLVVPVRFELEFKTVVDIVLEEVRRSKWELVATSVNEESAPRQAVIEAIATTAVFAFPDDVAIRIVEAGDLVRIDMRSASRFGQHDLGANARRITSFLERVERAVKERERV